ncbi:hypothetical protein [Ferruginibacter albus]|uniref:hypothetical protein n=1 Tax=Ferruginibacter albus TaxID=2875540 RepID=UPI001CC7EE5E|nr:hypothetical protein [Ferruginibacter albus]UAY51032.1 hypothetical protein K9M53_10570 [Ferruginibacter albus]
MKFIISLILTALLSYVACLFLPWWSIAIAAFVVAVFIPQSPVHSFFTGFIALFLLWGIMTYIISSNNAHALANKMTVIILKTDNSLMLIIATAFIGALVGGMAALTGSFIRKSKSAME